MQENLIDFLDRVPYFDFEYVNARRVKFWLDSALLPLRFIFVLFISLLIESYTHATILKSGEINILTP